MEGGYRRVSHGNAGGTGTAPRGGRATIGHLRRQQPAAAPESNLEWARRIAEAFKDIPAEDIEAMHRYGREFRESHTFPAEEGP